MDRISLWQTVSGCRHWYGRRVKKFYKQRYRFKHISELAKSYKQEFWLWNNNQRLFKEYIHYFPTWNVSIKREVQMSADSITKQSTLRFPSMDCLITTISVYVITYHTIIIDKQIIITVTTISVFLAESGYHITILFRFTPKCPVITAKVKPIA